MIPLRPVAKERARVCGKSTFTPHRTAEYESAVALYARAALSKAGVRSMSGNVTVGVRLGRECVEVDVSDGGPERWGRGDVDNYLKAILDGMQKGGVYANDRQVTSVSAAFK